ncbi:peptidoglycan D,D-transpeptidase FtsI family protein [Amphibiibacter pelophylacis]|uniref:Penicillin-binding protein 2 n=1 Tax=Amphibiibacter pelophylacis TaxID=1799477 RepID=A0ACC6P6H3_9BURK
MSSWRDILRGGSEAPDAVPLGAATGRRRKGPAPVKARAEKPSADKPAKAARAASANREASPGRLSAVMTWLNGRSDAADEGGMAHATSPVLASKTPASRATAIVVLLGVAAVVMAGRAMWVQWYNQDFYLQEGDKRYTQVIRTPGERGQIFDRTGQLLATSVPAPSIFAVPKELDASDTQRGQLARLLGMTPAQLDRRLLENRNFVWLQRQADPQTWDKIRALGLKGLNTVTESRRGYPEGEVMSQVLGMTNDVGEGIAGIELSMNRQLVGEPGRRVAVRNRLGEPIEIREEIPPTHGKDVYLSLDSKIQFTAFQAIRDEVTRRKAAAGSVVVLDAQTGEILALANYPTFDPENRRKVVPALMRNRAVTDTFEPGSTVKPFIAAWAMQTGRVRPNTVLPTASGRIVVSGVTLHDDHAFGNLTVAQTIQKSSNVGAVTMAMRFSRQEMWNLYHTVGFGTRPDLNFPGLSPGRLRPANTWRPVEQATMAYGYGLSASLLQLAHAYTVFTHDGRLMPLSILRRDPKDIPAGEPVVSAKVAAEIRHMLQMTAGKGGTAPLAQTSGYSVGGKTGTAHKQEGRGYASNKYRAWFVGLSPVEKPRIIVGVMVDEPRGVYYGGLVAAPVFSRVVERSLGLLGVVPDRSIQPGIITAKDMAPESVQ